MKFENEEILDKIAHIACLYGKEAALGYAIGILEMNKLDLVPTTKDLFSEKLRPAPNLKSSKNLDPPISEPSVRVGLDVGKIRKFESKKEEIKEIRTKIIKAVNEVQGLTSAEIGEYLKEYHITQPVVFGHIGKLIEQGKLCNTQRKVNEHGRECILFTLPNQINGNVVLTDHRKD